MRISPRIHIFIGFFTIFLFIPIGPAYSGANREMPATFMTLLEDAKKGDVEAQYLLGGLYCCVPDVVPTDFVEATKWWRRAAEQGHVEAQYHLGRFCLAGQGVPQDFVEAERLLRLSANQGHVEAAYYLGELLFYGEGQFARGSDQAN
jgi:TPR repeat protein